MTILGDNLLIPVYRFRSPSNLCPQFNYYCSFKNNPITQSIGWWNFYTTVRDVLFPASIYNQQGRGCVRESAFVLVYLPVCCIDFIARLCWKMFMTFMRYMHIILNKTIYRRSISITVIFIKISINQRYFRDIILVSFV